MRLILKQLLIRLSSLKDNRAEVWIFIRSLLWTDYYILTIVHVSDILGINPLRCRYSSLRTCKVFILSDDLYILMQCFRALSRRYLFRIFIIGLKTQSLLQTTNFDCIVLIIGTRFHLVNLLIHKLNHLLTSDWWSHRTAFLRGLNRRSVGRDHLLQNYFHFIVLDFQRRVDAWVWALVIVNGSTTLNYYTGYLR